MKMILLVPDGVGIRNYIFSSFIRNFIIDGNEVLVYHSISKSAIEEIQMNKSEIRDFKEIPDFKEKFIAMKGIVFTEFLEMVEDNYGLETVDYIIYKSELPWPVKRSSHSVNLVFDRFLVLIGGETSNDEQVPINDKKYVRKDK